MIPKNAIKKVKNDIHLEIAAGSLLAYGIFPQTQEGIQLAKETAASKDTWLAPSDLPEYYDGIDSDLITGKENDAIRAIRKTLKEFYGISSAGTVDFVDTSSSRPAVPAGIQITWFSITQVGPNVWEKLKAQLTGKGYFSEVNLSEKDADELISNIKKSGEFPSLKNQSGIHNEVYQNWLVDTYLPNYGQTQVYNPGDKFVDDGKEFADKIITDLDEALEDTSNEIMDDIDAIIAEDKRRYEEFKNKLNRKVNHPELYPELQHINPRYMWGQNGLYDLEFKSDIDRAIYFAGKLGSNKKDSEDKVAVRQWLLSVTGLSVYDDYEDIKKYRKEILDFILQLIKLKPQEREVVVPPIYDGYYQDPDDNEEEEDYEDLEEDLDGLDDLLNVIKSEEEIPEEKIVDDVEEEIVDAAEEPDEDPLSDEDLQAILNDEINLEDIAEKLQEKINKPKKESSYTSNKKIFDAIIVNFGRIQSTLDTVNRNLENQNELIKASIETQLAIGELISSQTTILTDKFDMILKQFEMQNAVDEDQADETKRQEDETRLESQRDAAGIVDFEDLTKGVKRKKRENKIVKYLKSRLTKKLYRKLPKSVRKARQRVRKFQRLPGKIQGRVANKLTSMLPSKGKQAVGALSKVKGMGSLGRMAGPARYAFAGLEYAERKAAGQSEVQALSGVGGGLAGAAAGGAAGAKLGATAGAAIGVWFGGVGAGPGAAIGAILGGLIGSIGGGMAGGAVADKVTGAHETGTGLTKPGSAILHGTEAVINKDAPIDMSPMSTLGGIMIASTAQFINSAGAVAAPIAPTFKGISAQMAKQYDVPTTVAQTNIGGSFPNIETEIKKVKEKKDIPTEEEFSGQELELLNTQDEDNFPEKLLKMIDPDGKIQDLMKNINRGLGGDGDSSFFPSSGDPSGLAEAAESLRGMSSASGPSGGANGCVWAVNKVYEKAGIRPPWGSSLYVPDAEKKMLAAGYTQVNYGDRRPGDVMVMYDRKSPPQAHIGVVLKNGNILSNSSSKAKFAWEASPEEYNRYYGGVGKLYRMPSTMARTESNKLQPVSTSPTPSLSSSGKRSATNAAVSNSQHQVTPTTTIAQAKPQQFLQPGSLVPGQRSDIPLSREQHRIAKQTREQGRAAGMEGMDLERHVASAVMNMSPPQTPQPNLNNQISAPPQRQQTIQKTMEIASLSYNNNEEENNNMLLINNQQLQGSSMPVNQTPMIIDMGGKPTSETLKNILLQRLSA